ncbi:MAG: gamma-glutamyl-gamma-aminobutyrate hydrolase family protein [Proteobacteria bacterium]|nr:MAG: gamma-glutamyl-gamma-aminobutyrate hydrolase family protein [Pseudomonadota bacterium]
MAARPRIGVTGAARRWSPSWWCTRLALAIAGGRAIRISVLKPEPGVSLDALIIGGGDDIGVEHYGGDVRKQVRVDADRDRLEIDWINRAVARGLPLLGICRGAQLVNVVLGGTLYQDIRHLRRLTYNRPGLFPTKQVTLEPDSRLRGTCGKARLRVNSLHHQAVRDPAPDLRVVGRDLDGIPQAIESRRGQRVVGVQWHPEYLFYLPAQIAIFRWLCAGASDRATQAVSR